MYDIAAMGELLRAALDGLGVDTCGDTRYVPGGAYASRHGTERAQTALR